MRFPKEVERVNRKEGLELTLNSSAHKGSQGPQPSAGYWSHKQEESQRLQCQEMEAYFIKSGVFSTIWFLSETRLRVICDHMDKM